MESKLLANFRGKESSHPKIKALTKWQFPDQFEELAFIWQHRVDAQGRS
jgi:hypothetical protein